MARICIVEDDPHIARMIEATLSIGGYESRICGDGLQAVEEILKGHYDMVLLDVMLPGMDGFEIIGHIRTKEIPVIFLTAKQEVSDKVKGLRLGPRIISSSPSRPWSCWRGWRWCCAGQTAAAMCCNIGISW